MKIIFLVLFFAEVLESQLATLAVGSQEPSPLESASYTEPPCTPTLISYLHSVHESDDKHLSRYFSRETNNDTLDDVLFGAHAKPEDYGQDTFLAKRARAASLFYVFGKDINVVYKPTIIESTRTTESIIFLYSSGQAPAPVRKMRIRFERIYDECYMDHLTFYEDKISAPHEQPEYKFEQK